MSDWFTVESLSPDTWAISECRHREENHCYLLAGTREALLIDTGLGVADLGPVVRALTALPLRVVTTHAHWDHIGSHASFSRIAVHPLEQDWISGQFPLPLCVVKENLRDPDCIFPEGFDWQAFQLYSQGASEVYADGNTFDLGGRQIQVLHTPGHSPGHCCFYEAERSWLFTGDLIYAGKLDAYYPSTDPAAFARSVRRVAELPLKRILPGHHTLAIEPELVLRVEAAFSDLETRGALHHGSGRFDFGGFQIQL